MSITPISELERLLDGDTYFERYYIDTPTLRALVNVAKAAREAQDVLSCYWFSDCGCQNNDDVIHMDMALQEVLAPLFSETSSAGPDGT